MLPVLAPCSLLQRLLLAQLDEAHHRPQLERLCFLLAGDGDGFAKTGFGFAVGVRDYGLVSSF